MQLDDLVLQAESIATNLEDDEVPHIHRNIEQLRKRGETFYNRAAQNDIKAAKLLGNKVGYELSVGLSKTLESLNVISSHEGSSAINIEDIPSFLRNERETAILSSINLTRNNTLNMSYKHCENAKAEWWKNEKSNILNLLVNSDKLPNIMPLAHVKSPIVNSGDNLRFTKTVLSKEELQYSREMSKYMDNLLSQSQFKESRTLSDILLRSESSPMNSSKCSELSEISRLISAYIDFKPNLCSSQVTNFREGDSQISKGMIEAALMHLEREYCAYVRHCVDGFISDPSNDTRRLMTTFVNDQLIPQLESHNLEDSTVNGVPVWPLIYAYLRSGLCQDAVLIAREASSNLGEFYLLLESWMANGALSIEQSGKLATEYKRHVRSSADVCKKLIYSLLAGCDIDECHSGVITSVDDFMWLRLTHLRASTAVREQLQTISALHNKSSGRYSQHSLDQYHHQSLGQLQKLIAEQYGEAHFKANQQPLTYCRILLLCQLFEPALAFLARFDHLRCHAVHLGIVLWQNNLLAVSSSLEAPLLSRHDDCGDSDLPHRLNLMRLVTLYTSKFENSHPRDALDLLFVLSDLPCFYGDEEVDGFVICASSLVIASGDFDLLFGRNEAINDGGDNYNINNANRIGLLARYSPLSNGVVDNILAAVAKRYRDNGNSESACDALQLAGRWQQAANEMAELVASTVSMAISSTNHSIVTRLLIKADRILLRMSSCTESALLASILSIARFIFASNEGDVEMALTALDRTNLLPTSSDAGAIRSGVDSFRNSPELVRSMFPGLLVAAMRTLRGAATLCRGSRLDNRYNNNNNTNDDSINEIRRRAAALITFTGQLPYRMPSEVYASLSQLEMEIN